MKPFYFILVPAASIAVAFAGVMAFREEPKDFVVPEGTGYRVQCLPLSAVPVAFALAKAITGGLPSPAGAPFPLKAPDGKTYTVTMRKKQEDQPNCVSATIRSPDDYIPVTSGQPTPTATLYMQCTGPF